MSLEQCAERFNQIILDDARDEFGIIRHQLTFPDRRPIPYEMLEAQRRDRDFRKGNGLKGHPMAGTPARDMYEDANYVGNRYLVAMVWRWLTTHSPEAGADAQTGYQATLYAAREGAKREAGYWPKPYGALKGEYAIDRSYTETSWDQSYSPVIALWRYYHHLASAAEKEEIATALKAQGHWWMRNNYAYEYQGEVLHSLGERITSPSVLKFVVGMYMAYQITDDTELRDEAIRLIRKAKADGALRMHRGPRAEIKDLYHWAEIYDYFMRETDLVNEVEWERLIRECWRAGKSTVQADGLCIGQGFFRDDGTIEAYIPGPIDERHHGYWRTDAHHPASTAQMAALGLLAYELGYDPEAAAVAKRLLETLPEENMGGVYGYLNPRPEQRSPHFREAPPLFQVRAVVFWLDAYWRGRRLGVL